MAITKEPCGCIIESGEEYYKTLGNCLTYNHKKRCRRHKRLEKITDEMNKLREEMSNINWEFIDEGIR